MGLFSDPGPSEPWGRGMRAEVRARWERAKQDWDELNIWLRIALFPFILFGALFILFLVALLLWFVAGFFYGATDRLFERLLS